MSTIASTFAAILILAAPGASATPNIRDSQAERELIELVHQWDAALVEGDPAVLDKILAEEFTLGGIPKGEYLEGIRSGKFAVESATSEHFDVRVYGDVAILIAEDSIVHQRGGQRRTDVYRYIDVWVRRDGRWQCVATESQPKTQ
jgi:ketosteroid isomerase-like protein